MATHLVDEAIETFASDDANYLATREQALNGHDYKVLGSKSNSSAWAMIRALRAKLDFSRDLNRHPDQCTAPHRSSLRQPSTTNSEIAPEPSKNRVSSTTASANNVAVRAGLSSGPISPPTSYHPFDESGELLNLSSLDARSSSFGQAANQGFKLDSNIKGIMSEVRVSPSSGLTETTGSTAMALDDHLDYDDVWSQLKAAGGAGARAAEWPGDLWGVRGVRGGIGGTGRRRVSNNNSGGGAVGLDDDSSISAGSRRTIGSDGGMISDESWIDAWIA